MYLSFGGRVGQDPELKTIPSGSTVCNFSVAVSGFNRQAREKTTTWVRVAIWGKRGEQLAGLIVKGSTVTVTGEFSTREHNGKTYLEVTTGDVTLLGSPPREQEEDDEPPQRQKAAQKNSKSAKDDDDYGDPPF